MFGADWIRRPLEKIFGSYKTREEMDVVEPSKPEEMEQIIEEASVDTVRHGGETTPWDAPSFVQLQQEIDARNVPSESDIHAILKEIVVKHVDVPAGMESKWHEFEFANLSGKYRVRSPLLQRTNFERL